MIRIVFFLLVVTAVAVLVAYIMRPRRRELHNRLVNQRVEAYATELRQKGGRFAEMPESEVRDLLLAGANSIEEESNRKNAVLGAMGVGAAFLAFLMASQEGTSGFYYVLGVAAVAGYGANQFWTRKIRAPLAAMGIDPNRLVSPHFT